MKFHYFKVADGMSTIRSQYELVHVRKVDFENNDERDCVSPLTSVGSVIAPHKQRINTFEVIEYSNCRHQIH